MTCQSKDIVERESGLKYTESGREQRDAARSETMGRDEEEEGEEKYFLAGKRPCLA